MRAHNVQRHPYQFHHIILSATIAVTKSDTIFVENYKPNQSDTKEHTTEFAYSSSSTLASTTEQE
jgi:hypothetical protein